MKCRGLAVVSLGMIFVFLAARDLVALNVFKKTFDEVYVKESGDEAFKERFKKNGCNVCHVKGRKRDVVNAYGMGLAKLIPGNAKQRIANAKGVSSEAKDAEEATLINELKAALKKVEGTKLPTGETYGEMLESHQLPSGEAAGSIAGEKTEEGSP
ncbi:MAG: hypothetical protein ACC628_19905 [Pirellulaceae bacterium]